MFLTTTRLLLLAFSILTYVAQAQPIPVPLGRVANDGDARPPVRRPWTHDVTTYLRLGWQNMPVDALNTELAQNGFSALSNQLRTVGLGVQMKISQLPLYLHTEVNTGLSTGASRGPTGMARLSVGTLRLGMGYRIWRKDGFQLIPHLGVMLMPTKLRISNGQLNAPTTLSAALKNPGASQTTQLNTSAGAIDLGLTANYRFSIQRIYDDCTTSERALVLALDGGYRIGTRPEFLVETDPIRRVVFGSSGWYIGVRLGAALRTDRAKSSASL
ncbi:MAG: hypothetical protein EAZ91_06495 [Cytophagales bacterium]|nr:MAG: hypothetical protein EAZ91_06495 [Cytophagales bacterium]